MSSAFESMDGHCFVPFSSSEVAQLALPDNQMFFPMSSRGPPPEGCQFHAISKILSFSVYPTCPQDLEFNVLLWRIANEASFDPATIKQVSGVDTLCLIMPRTLFHFLSRVSLEEMHDCVLSLLAEVAVDEDGYGLGVMESELEPSVFLQLKEVLKRGTDLASLSRIAEKVSPIIDELLLQMSVLEPWRIHTHLVSQFPRNPLTDDPLMEPVLFRKVLNQWSFYRDLVCNVGGGSLPIALDRFTKLVWLRQQSLLVDRAVTLLLCSKRQDSPLYRVPEEVIRSMVIPRVFLHSFNSDFDLTRPALARFRFAPTSNKRDH